MRRSVRPQAVRHALAALLLAGLLLWWPWAGFFGHELIATVAVFAILCMSLDLLAGYAGLVSLAHAAFFGAGAYLYALATVFWGWAAPSAMVMAVIGCGAIAWLVGVVAIRTHGLFFIMITLAFGEIGHEIVFRNRAFGGSDGLPGVPRMDLGAIGVDLLDPAAFSLLLLLAAAAVYGALAYLVTTPFGAALVGARENERRARAVGIPVDALRSGAFAIAGAVAGFAGTLTAQHIGLVTPQLLHWTTSGEILVMAILGGLGTLAGPAIGAAVLTLARHEIGVLTDYWGFWLGMMLVVVVVSGSRGIAGWIEDRVVRSGAARGGGAAEPGDAAG